jgi:hypothetical protein
MQVAVIWCSYQPLYFAPHPPDPLTFLLLLLPGASKLLNARVKLVGPTISCAGAEHQPLSCYCCCCLVPAGY